MCQATGQCQRCQEEKCSIARFATRCHPAQRSNDERAEHQRKTKATESDPHLHPVVVQLRGPILFGVVSVDLEKVFERAWTRSEPRIISLHLFSEPVCFTASSHWIE